MNFRSSFILSMRMVVLRLCGYRSRILERGISKGALKRLLCCYDRYLKLARESGLPLPAASILIINKRQVMGDRSGGRRSGSHGTVFVPWARRCRTLLRPWSFVLGPSSFVPGPSSLVLRYSLPVLYACPGGSNTTARGTRGKGQRTEDQRPRTGSQQRDTNRPVATNTKSHGWESTNRGYPLWDARLCLTVNTGGSQGPAPTSGGEGKLNSGLNSDCPRNDS